MSELLFRDDIFDNPPGRFGEEWRRKRWNEHFQCRAVCEQGPIFCETLMTVRGTHDIDAAIRLICGPWDWWGHGHTAGFTTNADGSSDQILAPVWWFITRVGLHIFPPADLPERKGRRVPLLLTGHFSGTSTMDVYPGESPDTLIVRGRFHGVDYTFPGVPNKVAEYLHLGAESGRMPVPFPKGTGWVGLRHRLEASTAQRRRTRSDETASHQTMDLVRLAASLADAGKRCGKPAVEQEVAR